MYYDAYVSHAAHNDCGTLKHQPAVAATLSEVDRKIIHGANAKVGCGG
jgi:hypothetical protein